MKLLKQVPSIEVKRCFVISDYAKRISVSAATRKILPRTEVELDRAILRGGSKRSRVWEYNRLLWYIGTVSLDELGAWRGAGGLPFFSTKGSVHETGMYVKKALKQNTLQLRSKKAIPGILRRNISVLQKNVYLLPIVVPGSVLKKRRRGMQQMKWEVDDGNMRAIALAVSGKKDIRAYVGVPVKKKVRTSAKRRL